VFVRIHQYQWMSGTPGFCEVLGNTLLLAGAVVVASTTLGLVLALSLF
jgi:ABC-type sugar transport system permease subunit